LELLAFNTQMSNWPDRCAHTYRRTDRRTVWSKRYLRHSLRSLGGDNRMCMQTKWTNIIKPPWAFQSFELLPSIIHSNQPVISRTYRTCETKLSISQASNTSHELVLPLTPSHS